VAAVSMSRRTVALVLAVALAALATIALISYVRGLEDKAFEGSETVDVFVAKDAIAAGVSGDTASQQGLVERRTVPAKVRPEGAIGSLDQISGRVAAVQVFKDEIIVQQRFVVPGAATKGVLPIPPGKQAISIAVAGAPAVAGFVQPGDQVSLIVQAPVFRAAAGQPTTITRYLLQNLDVIAVGTRIVSAGLAPSQGQAGQQQAADAAAGIFTFAVTPAQAEQLVTAALNTQLYFTLLPENSPPANTPGRNIANLFG
jgi:pilus assembly protein CpaB